MSGDKRARLKQWLESGEASLHPLTLMQRELWESSPVPAGDPANHICCLIHIRGGLTPDDCLAAVQRVVARQEVLRLSILPGKDRPLQMIRRQVETQFRFRELTAQQAQPEGIEELAREIFRQPFDMVQGPLYRLEMLQKAEKEFVLAFAIHHCVADGWTLGVFVQDLCTAYLQGAMRSPEPLPPVPQTYTAWGAAERAYWQPAEIEKRAAFWKPLLANPTRLWESPVRPKEVSAIPQRWVTFLTPETTKAVRDLARANGVTLFSTLLAVFQIALSRWTNATDILVGTPVANRNKQAARETMGSFAGIVPLRGQVDGNRPFSDGLRSVQDTTADSFANAMPFVELARTLGETAAPGRNPLFQVRFALQNHPIPEVDLPALSARLEMRSTGTARFDLACEITEMGEKLEVVWLFRTDLFSQTDVEKLRGLFQSALEGVCRAPARRLSELSI
jgi:hypothetical protein